MYSLFIGLGGAGIYSVAEFEQKINNHGTSLDNKFAYLDTDKKSLADLPFIRPNFIQLGGSDRNANHSIENLIKNSSKNLYKEGVTDDQKKKHVQFLRWYDQSIVSNEALSKGAEGIRMLSRAMLFADYPRIKRELTKKMTYTDPVDGQRKIRKIYVVSGTCGGTGSGIVLDILYLLNEISKGFDNMANQLPVNLLLVMPQGYVNGTKDTSSLFAAYRLNSYALIDEINACLKDYYGYYKDTDKTLNIETNEQTINDKVSYRLAGMQMNKYRCYDNEIRPFQFDVFQNAFLFDSVTKNGFDMTHEQRSEIVANFLFALELGSQANTTLDMHISNNIRTEKFNSAAAPFIKGFAATGMYVAQTWEELTRKYVRDKFMYQMLHYGFVGDGTVEDSVLIKDTQGFGNRVQNIINNRRNATGDGIDVLLSRILAGYDYKDLETILKAIKSSLVDQGHSFEAIFANSNEKETVQALCRAMDSLWDEVREETYTSCQDWIKQYNLKHALQLAQKMDESYDRQYKEKAEQMTNAEIEWYIMDKTNKRRKDCIDQFGQYIEYLVYRKLTYKDEGFLDDCKKCLTSAIKEINLLEYEVDNDKVEEWESKYIKYLNDLSSDDTRSVWPSLDQLYNKENACFVRGNEVERDYASLVTQTEDGSPDMEYDINKDKLLYTFKHLCFRELASQNGRWDEYFEMKDGPITFARNVRVAFDEFVKEVKKTGLELSKSGDLSKPFSQLSLNQDEKKNLPNKIEGFNKITTALEYDMEAPPSIGIYVADFDQMAWLKTALFPDGYDTMDKTPVQDATMSDRIIKLYVEFGHSLDEYRYFNDVYRPYFQAFFARISNIRTRSHQPYIDKRFLTEGKGDLKEFFTSTVKNEEVVEMKNGMRGQMDTFFKFCSLFLYKILIAHKDIGTLREKNMMPRDFFKFERQARPKRKKIITFGITNDFDKWKEREFYEPSGKKFPVDIYKTYSDTDLKKFAECFDFWKRFLLDMKDERQNSLLDNDHLLNAFNETRSDCNDAKNDQRSTFLNNLEGRYVILDASGRRIVQWKDMFEDFLKMFPFKK